MKFIADYVKMDNGIKKREKSLTKEIEEIKNRKSSNIDIFYNMLEDRCFYVVENFHCRLYDEEGDQVYMMDTNEEMIAEQQVGKFFVIDDYRAKKLNFLDDSPHVLDYFVVDLYGGYNLLIILPDIKFRDNRYGFYVSFYAKEISYWEAKRNFPDIDDYGFEMFIQYVGDIERSNAGMEKIDSEYLEKRKKDELQKQLSEFNEVMKKEAKRLKSETVKERVICKIRVPKSYRIQNKKEYLNYKIGRKLDKKIEAKRNRYSITVLEALKKLRSSK